MQDNRLHTAEGVRDYLPDEYMFKAEVEKKIENVFKSYGFKPIKSPTFEYMEVFEGKGSINSRLLYKFVDRDGSILALRSDMTAAIARIVSTAYSSQDLPLRFYYTENTFRYNENYQGKAREFTQSGVELIGADSAYADAEILAIAVKSILSAGISDFVVDIGHVNFLEGILDEGRFSENDRKYIHSLVLKKDYVAVEKLVKNMNIKESAKNILTQLPFMIGDIEAVKSIKNSITNKKSLSAISELENIYELLKSLGIEKYIGFDLSVLAYLGYYTGITFRGYCSGSGDAVLSGGRYDNLISKFNMNTPAVGFGIKINEILNALEAQNKKHNFENDVLLAVFENDSLIPQAENFREKGFKIESSLLGNDIEANKKYARIKNIKNIIYFGRETKIINVSDNSEKIIHNLNEGDLI